MKCQIIFLRHGRESMISLRKKKRILIVFFSRTVPSRPVDEHKSILRSESHNENLGEFCFLIFYYIENILLFSSIETTNKAQSQTSISSTTPTSTVTAPAPQVKLYSVLIVCMCLCNVI